MMSVSAAYGLWLWLMGYMGDLVIEARVQIFPDNIQRTKYRPIGPRKRALYANAKRPRKFDFRRALFGDLGFGLAGATAGATGPQEFSKRGYFKQN